MGEAALRLRGPGGPVPAHVAWPGRPAAPPALIVVLGPLGEHDCRRLSDELGAIVVAAAPECGEAAVAWSVDHAAQLGADPARLVVAGEGEGLAYAERLPAPVTVLRSPDRASLTGELARALA